MVSYNMNSSVTFFALDSFLKFVCVEVAKVDLCVVCCVTVLQVICEFSCW